jgi:hypothetical protein
VEPGKAKRLVWRHTAPDIFPSQQVNMGIQLLGYFAFAPLAEEASE